MIFIFIIVVIIRKKFFCVSFKNTDLIKKLV